MSFGSPAADYVETGLDLNRYLVPHPLATYFVRADSNRFASSGIFRGDILVVDRSLPPTENKLIIVENEGKLMLQKFKSVAAQFADAEGDGLVIWGVVSSVIRKV